MPLFDNLNHRLQTNKALTWRLNLRWMIGLTVAISMLGVPEAWALQVSPTRLSFTAVQGGTNPPNQTLSFQKRNSILKSWSITGSVSWVSVSPASGTFSTETEQVVVSVNPSGLAAGSFQATIKITVVGPKGGISNTSVPLALTLTAAPLPPTISLSPTSLTFTGVQGGANPSAQSVSISNKGGGSLSWSAGDNAAWLTLSPASGTAPGSTTASVNTASLTAGTYNATITATATGATNTPQTVPVTLTVTAVAPTSPTISLSPTSLSFTGTQGGTNPAAKTVSISNTGGGTLTWSASDNATWLTLSPASGTAPGGATASVNLTALTAGTYNATITAMATGATNTPQTVPVTLTVTVPTSQSAIVTSMVSDSSGAAVTIQGPGQVLEFSYNAQPTYAGIPSFTAGTASFRHAFAWPQGTTWACYRTKGTDNLYTEQACAPVTPGPPPTAGRATLTWNASTSSDLAGYKVYVGTASGVYGPATSVGNVTTYQLLNLTTGQTYFFAVTAADTSGNESGYSNEVSKSIY